MEYPEYRILRSDGQDLNQTLGQKYISNQNKNNKVPDIKVFKAWKGKKVSLKNKFFLLPET